VDFSSTAAAGSEGRHPAAGFRRVGRLVHPISQEKTVMTGTVPTWNNQQPSPMPSDRYRAIWDRVPVPDLDRTWPAQRTATAPLWVPVDLRDGNQALAEPMDTARKSRFFELLVRTGFKEIEVG
jgi:2-isopropylmalate synthase